jgi:tRNA modification GTPase
MTLDIDTIVAIATAPGHAGIGVIRISGPSAAAIALEICGPTPAPRVAALRTFSDGAEVIDQGVCLFFPSPASFTGEDVVELQAHGGPVVLSLLLEATQKRGARLARPGEFSERAFLNGKLDLTQAEAIADLINASTRSAARQAQASLQGVFSNRVASIAESLLALRVFVEAAIDFPEEEIDFLEQGAVSDRLNSVIEALSALAQSARQGALIQSGLSVVLAGKPNAGKSSLMNCLAEKDLAIVTNQPGTTRDIIREDVEIAGIAVRLSDTAGLREATDQIEQEGVRRAYQEVDQGHLLLVVVDDQAKESLIPITTNVPSLIVYNKIDLTQRTAGLQADGSIAISTKTGEGMAALRQLIAQRLGVTDADSTPFSARERHIVLLEQTLSQLNRAMNQFLANHAGELLAQDLRDAHQVLGQITGQVSSDQLLGEIFSSFCIGK